MCGFLCWRLVGCETLLHAEVRVIQRFKRLARITINNVFEGLIRRHPKTYEFVPALATAWKFSADGKTLTFTLRRGVSFHDGKPFGAKDVVFTFNRLMDPATATAPARSDFAELKRWQAVGKHQVRLTFGRALVLGLEFQLAADILGTAVSPSWDHLGKLGAIAVIRTFLNFFLTRELKEEEQDLRAAAASPQMKE